MRTRVKICGITRPEDGVEAARLGADAIGLVFYANSPRVVDCERAAEIAASLPPFVTTVGLFVDPSADEVEFHNHLRRVKGRSLKETIDLANLGGLRPTRSFAQALFSVLSLWIPNWAT